MKEFLTFIPLIVMIGIGLLLVIPRIRKDRKLRSSYKIHHNYASFWLRLVAFFIDFIVASFIFNIIRFTVNLELDPKYIVQDYGFFVLYRGPIVFVITGLYFILFESSRFMATLGKLAVGIKVTNLLGKRITIWNATGRFFGKFLSSIFLCMGYIMIFFMSTKQALHDDLAQTVVIKRRSPNIAITQTEKSPLKTNESVVEPIAGMSDLKPSSSATDDLGLLTTLIIANGLKISDEEVIGLITSNQLKGKKIGDKYFVRKEDFDEFMKK